jgi:nucleoside-diphosphate-sugar epimerase
MKTTVFGATGYLGSHTAEQLTLAGHEVVCVVRQGSDCRFLETLPVTIVRANFDDPGQLAQAIAPGGAVLNCVAETRMHLADAERRRVEIDLTSRLFNAARAAGAKRFVQLSTVMIYGFDRPVTAIDENYPIKPRYSYSRIAAERERALLDLAPGSGVELLILRPSNTLGKRDSSALPAIMAGYEKGSFAVIGGGQWRYSCMDGRDTGRAMAHLLEVPVARPEIFLVKGYDICWLDLKTALDQLFGRQTRVMNLPKGLAMALGWLMEKVTPYGKNPPLTRFSVEVLSTHTLFDDRKIRATGFEPRYDLMATLRDALDKPVA